MDSQIKIAFGGGGDAEGERQVLDLLGTWVGRGRLLYVPLAMDPPYDGALEWARAALGPSGITDVTIATSPGELTQGLARSDGVFIGGGNTYSLLGRLRSGGADLVLRDAIDRGLPIYGGSAGAILLGRDIDTARNSDANHVGLSDTTGLDMALGYSIACHYSPTDDPVIRDYVGETAHPVLALPERGGLVRTGERIVVVGPEPATLFGPQGALAMEQGTQVRAAASMDGVDREA